MGVKNVDVTTSFPGMALPTWITAVSTMACMSTASTAEGDVRGAGGATRDGGLSVVAGGAPGLEQSRRGATTGPPNGLQNQTGDRDWVSDKLQTGARRRLQSVLSDRGHRGLQSAPSSTSCAAPMSEPPGATAGTLEAASQAKTKVVRRRKQEPKV